MKTLINLKVNGEEHELAVSPNKTLGDLLRYDLMLTGTKKGCGTGEARLTGGYRLKARYVIHTVGTVYSGRESDAIDLRNCYYSSLSIASQNNIRSISFPSISTGIFGYPVKEASIIALETISGYLKKHPEVELVKMVLFSESDYREYKASLENILLNTRSASTFSVF